MCGNRLMSAFNISVTLAPPRLSSLVYVDMVLQAKRFMSVVKGEVQTMVPHRSPVVND